MPENELAPVDKQPVMEAPPTKPKSTPPSFQSAINKLILGGDLSVLSERDLLLYYKSVCDRVGLDYLTRPFLIMKTREGKLILYLDKGGAEQLTMRHSISHEISSVQAMTDLGIVVVTAKATGGDGRVEDATGAVSIQKLTGEALANAFMKAETKAKRRSTIAMCGLGAILDETEAETIPGAVTVEFDPNAIDGEVVEVSQETRESIAAGAAKLNTLGVTVEMLLKYFGRQSLNDFADDELSQMRAIVVALQSKAETVESLFGESKLVAEQPPLQAPTSSQAGTVATAAGTAATAASVQTVAPKDATANAGKADPKLTKPSDGSSTKHTQSKPDPKPAKAATTGKTSEQSDVVEAEKIEVVEQSPSAGAAAATSATPPPPLADDVF